jgi:hypothetical protein
VALYVAVRDYQLVDFASTEARQWYRELIDEYRDIPLDGISWDEPAGAVDYFRLNDAMDAGYTDCCWWDPASVAYSYALASSLGRLTPTGAAVIDRSSWERIESFARAGGRVIFAGPPPSVDGAGDDLTVPFAALLGIEPLHADAYDAWFHQTGAPLPQNRPERFDLAYPVAVDAPRAIVSAEGDVHGVRAPQGETSWFSGYEASQAVLAELRRLAPPPVACHSATTLWRLYREGERALLMLIAREDEVLSGIVEFAGWHLRLDGGTCACLEIQAGGEAHLHREDDGQHHSDLLQRSPS